MFFSGNKPSISFKEFKSYGPYELDDIITEAAKKSAEERAIQKFKVKLPPKERMASYHRQAGQEHAKAHHHLTQAAGYVPSESQREHLLSLAKVHKEAADAHESAATAHDEYNNKGLVGSGQRRRDAKRATEEAHRLSEIANEHN